MGMVITGAGTDVPNVTGLVYIAGTVPAEGETLFEVNAQFPPPSPSNRVSHRMERIRSVSIPTHFTGPLVKILTLRALVSWLPSRSRPTSTASQRNRDHQLGKSFLRGISSRSMIGVSIPTASAGWLSAQAPRSAPSHPATLPSLPIHAKLLISFSQRPRRARSKWPEIF